MSASMTFEEYGDGIGEAWTVLREHANRAGLDTAVATCPDWTVRDLVVHQGTVHRWATAHLLGERGDGAAFEAEGQAAPDLLGWLDRGAKRLLQTLADAPDDLDAFFFLKDAAAPKFAWARRQCHETTVHAVDAMSASYGGPPAADRTWLRPRLAADGIDELLCGFVPRRSSRLHSAEPVTVRVLAKDIGDAWTMRISQDPVVTTAGGSGAADVTVAGDAVPLYLGLWNRGEEFAVTDPAFADLWRASMTVTWG